MDKKVRVTIPIGREAVTVSVPNLIAVAEPEHTPAAADEVQEVRRALEEPIGSPRLRELARGRKNAVIVINDITRPYPGGLMVREIARELNEAGIPDEQISLLVAYGQHRENTPEELSEQYGADVIRRFRVVHHHASKAEETVTIGKTSGGVPVTVNRFYMESDLKILTGCIAPHQFAGFSGGRKSVIPGIAGIDSIARHHSFPIRPERISLGRLENNPFHLVALEAARMTGVDFIVNSVDNTKRELVRCVAGDLEAAYYAGVEISRKIWTVPIRKKPGIVIVSPGGFPRDLDLHQSQKSIGCAEMVLEPGGGLILCARCPDGSGKPGALLRAAKSPEELIQDFCENGMKPNGNGKAYMLARAAKRFRIILAGSCIPQSELRQMFMDGYDTVEEALSQLLGELGGDTPVLVIPNASEIIPVVAPENEGGTDHARS